MRYPAKGFPSLPINTINCRTELRWRGNWHHSVFRAPWYSWASREIVKSQGMRNYSSDNDRWREAFADYVAECFPVNLLEHDISSGAASFRMLSRSLPVIRYSRPLGERRVGRVRRRNRILSSGSRRRMNYRRAVSGKAQLIHAV